MAGLSSKGLEIKRLGEVIEDRISSARSYFGGDAATTSNDVLGRALRVTSPSESDLWELSEAVYNSFNPNLATGVSLDRIVAYAGLTRFTAAPSQASLLVSGDFNAAIPVGAYVDSSFTSHRFTTTGGVALTSNGASGVTLEVITATDNTAYTVSIAASTFTYTSSPGDTKGDIAESIKTLVNNSSDFSARVINDVQVEIKWEDVFVRRDVTLTTANMSFQKISKIVNAEAEEVGPIEQPSNTLDTISSPITGWDSVTNPQDASTGRYRETDEELRIRFSQSKELNARGTVDAIYSTLLSVTGVEEVQVYENSTSGVDARGLPSKSFSAVVLGGSANDIAESIWGVKPAGIESFGNTDVSINDVQGLPHTISFSRPDTVDIHIEVTISPYENQEIAANAEELIIDAFEDYFSVNYGVGDNVIYSRLYTPLNNATPGHQVDSLLIGTTANPSGQSNIDIEYDQIANLLRGNVNVIINN